MAERVDVLWPDLDSCIDVDLGWTPATNLLPLRRIPLTEGQSLQTTAAWVRYPHLDVVPSEQTYIRLRLDRVRYESSTFEAELVVTPDGLTPPMGTVCGRRQNCTAGDSPKQLGTSPDLLLI